MTPKAPLVGLLALLAGTAVAQVQPNIDIQPPDSVDIARPGTYAQHSVRIPRPEPAPRTYAPQPALAQAPYTPPAQISAQSYVPRDIVTQNVAGSAAAPVPSQEKAAYRVPQATSFHSAMPLQASNHAIIRAQAPDQLLAVWSGSFALPRQSYDCRDPYWAMLSLKDARKNLESVKWEWKARQDGMTLRAAEIKVSGPLPQGQKDQLLAALNSALTQRTKSVSVAHEWLTAFVQPGMACYEAVSKGNYTYTDINNTYTFAKDFAQSAQALAAEMQADSSYGVVKALADSVEQIVPAQVPATAPLAITATAAPASTQITAPVPAAQGGLAAARARHKQAETEVSPWLKPFAALASSRLFMFLILFAPLAFAANSARARATLASITPLRLGYKLASSGVGYPALYTLTVIASYLMGGADRFASFAGLATTAITTAAGESSIAAYDKGVIWSAFGFGLCVVSYLGLAWIRARATGNRLTFGAAAAAVCTDIVPGLNLIPGLTLISHCVAVVSGAMGSKQRPAAVQD